MKVLRRSIRAVAREWATTLSAVGVLGTAIAVTAVVFAFVDGLLLKPLPYERPTDLFLLQGIRSADASNTSQPLSWADIHSWRVALPRLQATVLSAKASPWYQTPDRQYWMASIDETFFGVLGVQPALGGFTAEDFAWVLDPKASDVSWPVLISQGLWQRTYQRDRNAVGKTLHVSSRDGKRFGLRIAGVLSSDFAFPTELDGPEPDILVPFSNTLRRGRARQLRAIARISGGPDELARVSAVLSQSAAELARTAPPLPAALPHAEQLARSPFDRVLTVPLATWLGSTSRAGALAAVGASLMLALLALGGLIVLWTSALLKRLGEFRTRFALGEGLASIWFTEFSRACIVCIPSLTLGLLAAVPLLSITELVLPEHVTFLKPAAIDARTAAFAFVVAFMSALAISSAALMVLWRRHAAPARTQALKRRRLLIGSLVAVQICCATVLLSRGLDASRQWLGVWTEDLGMAVDLGLIEAHADGFTASSEAVSQLTAGIVDLQRRFGAADVAASSVQPILNSGTPSTTLMPQGLDADSRRVSLRAVTTNYFDLLGIRLLAGELRRAGWTESSPIAVVSATAATEFWEGRNPIGQRLVSQLREDPVTSRTVIGVVDRVRYISPEISPICDLYIPGPFETGTTSLNMFVRLGAGEDVNTAVGILRARGLRIVRAVTLENALFDAVKHRALPAWLLGSLVFVALPIVTMTVFGTTLTTLKSDVHQLSIRAALGARPIQILRLVARYQLWSLAVGLTAGVIISITGREALHRLGFIDADLRVGSLIVAVSIMLVLVALSTSLAAWPYLRKPIIDGLRNADT